MRYLWLLCLTGCLGPMPPHCVATGGLQVYGDGLDCTEYSRAVSIAAVPVSGWYLEVVDSLPPGRGGETDCSLHTMTILRGPLGEGAFFHETMHVRDFCSTPNHEGWDVPGGFRDQWVAAAQCMNDPTCGTAVQR